MNRQALLEQLRTESPVIAPSMLKCDFGNLQRELELLESAGARALHLDVMDGHFVPNLSYGPMVIKRMRQLTDLPFDAHLMISEPGKYLDEFLDAGCDLITFHTEAVDDPLPLLERIRSAGAAAGVALNPGTPVADIKPLLSECDLVLVMSVEPGFGGQKFMPASIEKLRQLKDASPSHMLLGIDGGIGPETIEATAQAGANLFVVGSAIFDAADYGQAINELACLAGNNTDVASAG
ncbi:MAG: ribulose-phosphate 3-epimerase [Planctomycetaceae bacterium]|jgi:ribulose-phosphate 3-epimerase|nr:ribulose-phosphate 3-epimerase [Planctomycetaceae bacterium]MBT6485449.1 ribulose-phosphate 3-epimerase [Planctomycetaceae bacterium]MBT6497245.1 ribulose-phosphate 3-epimerase [Planctomycetaceae bacterium]